VAKLKASFMENFRKIAKAELVTQIPSDHQKDHVSWLLQMVKGAAASLVEFPLAIPASEFIVAQ